jgi:FAD/FMN-containing dehydrogenase
VGAAWTDQDRQRLAEIASRLCDEAEADGLTGRSIFWQRDKGKILADLDRFLTEDDALRNATGMSPSATELPFGIGDRPPVAFPLTDGRAVPLRGKADRVDHRADGSLHVASEKDDADLFWAIRGGGGNFGVVTSFEFRLSPVKDIYGGPMFFELDRAGDVLRFYRDFIVDAPEQLGCFPAYQIAPPLPFIPEDRHGEPFEIEGEGMLAVCLCHEIDHLDGILYTDKRIEDATEEMRRRREGEAK